MKDRNFGHTRRLCPSPHALQVFRRRICVYIWLMFPVQTKIILSSFKVFSTKNWDICDHFGSSRGDANDCSHSERWKSDNLVEINLMRIYPSFPHLLQEFSKLSKSHLRKTGLTIFASGRLDIEQNFYLVVNQYTCILVPGFQSIPCQIKIFLWKWISSDYGTRFPSSFVPEMVQFGYSG